MNTSTVIIKEQLNAAVRLRERIGAMSFASPVVCVYNPLTYAWRAFEEYVTRYGATKKRVLFLGMNPGPWGMAQTGVPFGEVSVVNEWLRLTAPIDRPADEHPKYPVDGYGCERSEVSGRRLWGLFRERCQTADAFFKEHFVVNYCPLLFIASSILKNGRVGARNLTPDKLSAAERADLYEACNETLLRWVEVLEPQFLVGVGNFAADRAEETLKKKGDIKLCKILHPSPASPKSNTDWSGEATRQLQAQGVW